MFAHVRRWKPAQEDWVQRQASIGGWVQYSWNAGAAHKDSSSSDLEEKAGGVSGVKGEEVAEEQVPRSATPAALADGQSIGSSGSTGAFAGHVRFGRQREQSEPE
ncbi:hypothetical protein GN956_G11139 [Arapaima gigas]